MIFTVLHRTHIPGKRVYNTSARSEHKHQPKVAVIKLLICMKFGAYVNKIENKFNPKFY